MNLLSKYILILLATSTLFSCKDRNTQGKEKHMQIEDMPNKKDEKAITKIIAHRGFSEIAPENTLAAFKKAIEVKPDYFELDVHKSKDDVLVVIHDHSVDRTSSNNKKGKIKELNYAELQEVHVGFPTKFEDKYKDEKIPTLKEALLLAKGKIKVCIEIKVLHVEKQVVALIEELDMINAVIVFGFDYETVKKVKILNPKLETLFLQDKATLATLDSTKAINASAIGVGYHTKITEEFVSYAHKNNIKVFRWTVNNEQEMKDLIALKLDGLITNKPDVALKLIQ